MQISNFKKNHLAELIAALLIFLFVYTAISKLMNIDNFKTLISKSPVIRRNAVLLSWLIPSVELFVGLMLFIPASRGYAFLFSSILMGIFTFYVACMLLFIPNLPCSCGGVIQQMNWTQH